MRYKTRSAFLSFLCVIYIFLLAEIGDGCSFDLDLPLECDDEYWEDGFKQPPDKPSSITFFNCYLGLIDILAYAMRLIVSMALFSEGL